MELYCLLKPANVITVVWLFDVERDTVIRHNKIAPWKEWIVNLSYYSIIIIILCIIIIKYIDIIKLLLDYSNNSIACMLKTQKCPGFL